MPMNAAPGGMFFIIWLFMMLGSIAGFIVLLTAIWRGMKAHESIAESLRTIANKNNNI